ncbi:MAG: 3-oxoacyl-ACP reductase [Candidatus Pacebacteria bacterium CG_4_10_14_0_8_um_filter_42_14]|nr:MAG: 3-oxoacyl-ACP reductase [Candidatus Pacebacteria bacterium CG_4_10_14_0_8_um_filter_42_14]
MKLQNKVAIVTGSSRGIGKATAILFHEEGAKVIVNYKTNKKAALDVVKGFDKGNYLLVQADVSKEADVKRLVAETIEKFGKIDILVNNAGEIIRPGNWKSDVETWDKTFAVNLTSAWLMTKEVVELMKANGGGAIVNIVSVYGFLGAAPVLAYTSAKAGLITMTKSFAKELAPAIRVNAVAPSNVMTDMTKGAGKELIETFRKQTPLKRIAEPEELAKAILFLASDDASYITGEMLVVDGGYSLR